MLKRLLFRSEFHVTEHCQWEYGAKLEVAIISTLGKSCSKTAHGITASSSSPHDEGLQKNQPNLPACPANNSHQHTLENAAFDFLKAAIHGSYKKKRKEENEAGSFHMLLPSHHHSYSQLS